MTKKLTAEDFKKEVLEVLEEQEAVINPPALLQQLMAATRQGLGQTKGTPPLREV